MIDHLVPVSIPKDTTLWSKHETSLHVFFFLEGGRPRGRARHAHSGHGGHDLSRKELVVFDGSGRRPPHRDMKTCCT